MKVVGKVVALADVVARESQVHVQRRVVVADAKPEECGIRLAQLAVRLAVTVERKFNYTNLYIMTSFWSPYVSHHSNKNLPSAPKPDLLAQYSVLYGLWVSN